MRKLMLHRCLLALGALGALLLGAVSALAADNYPSRAITIYLGFPPGGGTDGPTRLIADKLRVSLGVPVVVENKPGANQMIAIQQILGSKPDGYSFLVGTGSSLVQNPAVNPQITYDPLKDFTPVALFGTTNASIAVGPSLSQIKSLKELIDHIKANPEKLTYASSGLGSANHLEMELLSKTMGLKMVHVPYRGDAPATLDIAEGRVDLGMPTFIAGLPFVKAGKLRLLGHTSVKKLSFAPDLPTLKEAGLPELEVLDPFTFYGIVGPAGLPPEIVKKVNEAVNEAVRSPEIADIFRNRLYTEPVTETPEAFRAFIEQHLAKWKLLRGQIDLTTN